jgi:glutathione synthase
MEPTAAPAGDRPAPLRSVYRPVQGEHAEFGPEEPIDLGGVDVILMRQDPPSTWPM